MLALGKRRNDKANETAGTGMKPGRGVARLNRRPVWREAGFLAHLPVWTGTAGALGFLGATVLYGMMLGGYTQAATDALTAEAGFSIKAIQLSGQRETTEFEILEELEIPNGSSLLTFDAAAARQRLQRNPWVRDVSVQKFYPGTLKVSLSERVPYALWQRGKIVSIIDRDGTVITDEVKERYANLPLVVGHGAQKEAPQILAELDGVPELRSRVRALVLIAERRWNLVLENNITVRLPEDGVDEALRYLVRLDQEKGLLSRDITAVDLRLKDRIVVRLAKDAKLNRGGDQSGVAVSRKGADT
ncbi:cell division protein FtsQ [Breoghania corrubedonensis]|uniref:Cell division protein FtsQ n=1 Tax=Breoghania corrubedonensis TaxID=665038 RepID=A0A2T5V4Y2_9HYPH|nr:cell division protein FtsQ/DivIB [Breoghania corrubedonensis]PTW58804.1 cell division protein FtsQ [Breoghania corrubedonensis]